MTKCQPQPTSASVHTQSGQPDNARAISHVDDLRLPDRARAFEIDEADDLYFERLAEAEALMFLPRIDIR